MFNVENFNLNIMFIDMIRESFLISSILQSILLLMILMSLYFLANDLLINYGEKAWQYLGGMVSVRVVNYYLFMINI